MIAIIIIVLYRKHIETITELLNKQPSNLEATKESVSQALNFQALIRPNKAQLDQISQISRLEERLRKLESTIGTSALTLVRIHIVLFFVFSTNIN